MMTHLVGIEIEGPGVQMMLGVDIVGISLALQPGELPPFGRGKRRIEPSTEHIGDFVMLGDMTTELRALEGERGIDIVGVSPFAESAGGVISLQIETGIDRGCRRQTGGVDVVAATSEVVVGVPVVRGQDDGNVSSRFVRRHHPGEGKEASGRFRMQIVEPGSLRTGDELGLMRIGIADLVPLDAGLGVVAVWRDLHHRPGTMLVEDAEIADEFLLQSVAPEGKLIRFDRVNPELRFFTGAYPLWPDVTEQAVGK